MDPVKVSTMTHCRTPGSEGVAVLVGLPTILVVVNVVVAIAVTVPATVPVQVGVLVGGVPV